MTDMHHDKSETAENSGGSSAYDDGTIHKTAGTLFTASLFYNLYLLFVPLFICILFCIPFAVVWYSGIIDDTLYFAHKEGFGLPILIWIIIVMVIALYFSMILHRRNNLYIIIELLNMGRALLGIPVLCVKYVRACLSDVRCREFVVDGMPSGIDRNQITVINLVRAMIENSALQKSEQQVFSLYADFPQNSENDLNETVARICGYATEINGGSPKSKKVFCQCIRLLDSAQRKKLVNCFNAGTGEMTEQEDYLQRLEELAPAEMFRRKDYLNWLIKIVYAGGAVNDRTLEFIGRFGEALRLNEKEINLSLKYHTGGKYRITLRKKPVKSSAGNLSEKSERQSGVFGEMNSETVQKYRNAEADRLLMTLLGYILASFGEIDEERHELLLRMMDSVGMPEDEEGIRAFRAGASVKYAPYDDIAGFREKYQQEDPDEIKLLLLKLLRMIYVDGEISEREQLLFAQIGLGFGFHENQTSEMIAREKKRQDAIAAQLRQND